MKQLTYKVDDREDVLTRFFCWTIFYSLICIIPKQAGSKLKYLARRVDSRLNLMVILFLFWALFWGLNGGDKFFNGKLVSNIEDWSAKGVLVDEQGDIAYTLHPMETIGLYGINRDAQMINFFGRIHLPPLLALTFLYGIAVAEILLGLTFLALLIWSLLPEAAQNSLPLFADRTIHRLAFKGSILIFLFFTIGDTLFGDRAELWEHSTFIILGLISYAVWAGRERFSGRQHQILQVVSRGSHI